MWSKRLNGVTGAAGETALFSRLMGRGDRNINNADIRRVEWQGSRVGSIEACILQELIFQRSQAPLSDLAFEFFNGQGSRTEQVIVGTPLG